MTSTGTLTSLLSFGGSNGRFPDSRLTQGTNGNLYGVTYYGSNAYELSLSGKYLMSSAVGTQPTGALVQASDGNFYGTTTLGGANSAGSVFKMTPGGKVTTIYTFCTQSGCPDGAQPYSGLIQATDGFLYGTTSQGGAPTNGGTIFRISPAGSLTTYIPSVRSQTAPTATLHTRDCCKPPMASFMARRRTKARGV
jgi:uncharacterized repeat protein (TIGR03803 family)